jgi:hypothetical protein
MKYLRVTIKREANPKGGTHYVYPPEYDAHKVRFGPSYETFNPSKIAAVKARPQNTEDCVIAVDDVDEAAFLASPDIVSITEADFIAEGDDNDAPQREHIEDEQEVLRILDKVRKGTPLSPVDLDAIDGDKPNQKGVGKSKKFSEQWTARKAELGV